MTRSLTSILFKNTFKLEIRGKQTQHIFCITILISVSEMFRGRKHTRSVVFRSKYLAPTHMHTGSHINNIYGAVIDGFKYVGSFRYLEYLFETLLFTIDGVSIDLYVNKNCDRLLMRGLDERLELWYKYEPINVWSDQIRWPVNQLRRPVVVQLITCCARNRNPVGPCLRK